MLSHFLYRSTATPGLNDSDIQQILTEARERNARLGLTGCLHVEDGIFFQWLEGSAAPVAEVVGMLRRDSRHSDIETLSEGPLQSRLFDHWSMLMSDRNDSSIVNWLAEQAVSRWDGARYIAAILQFMQKMSLNIGR
ncbi:MAG: BLUF domain-containing protein [Paracoccus sp. (in: a-proteobacteria)]|nr:BLUF domain-containing protein [Paracoccus sp. (in: a-proteobacteria)]